MAEEYLNLGEPLDVRARNKALKAEEIAFRASVEWVMSTKQGRVFIAWLISITQLNANAFDRNGLQMAFMCGQQNVGNAIMAQITIPELAENYFQMMREIGEKDVYRSNASTNAKRADSDNADVGS